MSNTIVNTNVSALNSHRAILSVGGRQARSAERLSSGQRINRAADDAAGLSISEGMRNQIRGLDQSVRNSQDGISLVQTAEGALEEVHRILERARVLTVQAANDTNAESDRMMIHTELAQLGEELERITSDTEFNGMAILDGSSTSRPSGGSFNIQAGANSGQNITIQIGNARNLVEAFNQFVEDFSDAAASTTAHDDLTALIGDSTQRTDMDALSGGDTLSEMISAVSNERSNMGAVQNRLEHTINSLRVSSENLSAANSRIRDTDMAAEMMNFTQANVLQQAGMSMLAQANMAPQNILQLVG